MLIDIVNRSTFGRFMAPCVAYARAQHVANVWEKHMNAQSRMLTVVLPEPSGINMQLNDVAHYYRVCRDAAEFWQRRANNEWRIALAYPKYAAKHTRLANIYVRNYEYWRARMITAALEIHGYIR